jgi:hypothetical protein
MWTDTFAKENDTIRDIQTHMETYFQQRDTRIARDGLTALTNTLAGIYYIPFKVKHKSCQVMHSSPTSLNRFILIISVSVFVDRYLATVFFLWPVHS